jgi:hypothetical protein
MAAIQQCRINANAARRIAARCGNPLLKSLWMEDAEFWQRLHEQLRPKSERFAKRAASQRLRAASKQRRQKSD